MTSRISGLTDIDPLSVPLPHGTEVTTRVEKLASGRRIPQGLIGRVVRARDGGFDVMIVGVGELWYARAEIAPRKSGQLEFAERRETAWSALLPCTVLTATVGSRAWGLADEASDTDVRGAFALPFLWTVGLVSPPLDLVSADGSQTFWEPAPSLDEVAGRLAKISPRSGPDAGSQLLQAKTYIKQLYRSLSDQGLIETNDPDSDLDVKAVHLAGTAELLGFPRAPPAAERLEVLDGVEVDYSSNELAPVLLGVLKGNGNYLERFLSGYTLSTAPGFEALQALVRQALSQRVYRHYAGFAHQQRQEWEQSGRASAKKLLYVLRTTLTGAHLLRTGEVVTDLTRLLARYGFEEALELVEQKRRGEKSELPPALSARWEERVPRAFEVLDAALAASPLPAEPPNAAELEAWLVKIRLDRLQGLTPRRSE